MAEEPAHVLRFALLGASQSPSRLHSTIRFSLARKSMVDLRVYSAAGKLIRVLRSGRELPGHHQTVWDHSDDLGRPVSRGAYFCRMTADQFRAVGKLTLVE